jgi:radical SAM protein with 4Fe4S-binding SPASM domain
MTAARAWDPPAYVLWEITLACNLRCRHCLTSSGLPGPDELDEAQALALCDELADLGVAAVALLGGEPLVRPDWASIAERLSARGVSVGLVTNGVRFDDRAALRARAAGVRQIVVSLDGSPPVHDALRGRGSFVKALGAIRRAREAGFRHRMVVTSVHRDNLSDLPSLIEPLREHAPGAVWALNQTSIRPGRRMAVDKRLGAEQFLRLVELIESARQALAGVVDVVGSHDIGYCSVSHPNVQGSPWHGCNAGRRTMGITARGEVKGCLALPDDHIVGRVPAVSIARLWHETDAFASLRHFDPSRLGERCRGCPHGEQCRGGCLEHSLTTTGRPHSAPYCLRRFDETGTP